MTKIKTALDHLNLTVRDFSETKAWYNELFGFEVVEEGLSENGSPWGILRSGDSMLCVYENVGLDNTPEEGGAPSQFHCIYHFGLRITDRARWERVLVSKKIRTYYGGAVGYPHSTSWYVRDPSGHMIEVVLWDNDVVKFASEPQALFTP